MPKENTDRLGYGPRVFRFEKKWLDKINVMPKGADESHFVRIHLRDGSYQNAIVIKDGYIIQHVVFRDDDIVDVTPAD